MKKFNICLLTLVFFSITSCKKYLEAPNKKQADITTADQLEALINNATLYAYDGSNQTIALSTDDAEINLDAYKTYPSTFLIDDLFYYAFDVNYIISKSADPVWTDEYKKIFNANVVLANIDAVTGSEAQKNRIKADAYFIRAYSYWNLVNFYCLPYSASNLQSKGLPIKRTTLYTESLQRASLQETYNFILEDIAAAQALLPPDDVNSKLRWRISKPAIDAFLSRFYLFTNDYDKAIQYANSALTSTTAQLVDYKAIGAGLSETFNNPSTTLKYAELNNWAPNKFLYWNEFFYTRFTYYRSQWYMPSTNLLSIYDTNNDLRYQLFMIPNGGRSFGVITPSLYRYTVFYDGRYLPVGPTVAEVLLNKAEATARKGDVTEALNAANLLRAKRLKNYDALTATDKTSALTNILQERRRELPFSFRWWDIRRFSVNEDPSDDVSISHTFYKLTGSGVDMSTTQTYTLPVKSLRYAVPINQVEINNSRGQIEQNNY